MKNNTAMPIKIILTITGALYGLLLGAAAYADTAKPTAPTQPATASAPVHAVTLYGLTLGEVLPQLPQCHPDVAFGEIGDDICITYAEGAYSTLGPHLKYGTADEVGIWFPRLMRAEGYPWVVTVGTDKDDRMVYFSILSHGYGKITTGIHPELTQQDQQQHMAMINGQLGKPDIYVIRTRVKDDDIEDKIIPNPPGGVSQVMWSIAAYGAIMAVWDKEDVWCRYIGELYSQKDTGLLEIGLKSMFADGQVPDN